MHASVFVADRSISSLTWRTSATSTIIFRLRSCGNFERDKSPVVYHINDLKLLCPSYNPYHGDAPASGVRRENSGTSSLKAAIPIRAPDFLLAAEACAAPLVTHVRKVYGSLSSSPSEFVRTSFISAGFETDRASRYSHFQDGRASVDHTPLGNSVLYFGRLSAEKGVDDLLHAVKSLTDILVEIAGEGPNAGTRRLSRPGLNSKTFEFLGHLQATL